MDRICTLASDEGGSSVCSEDMASLISRICIVIMFLLKIDGFGKIRIGSCIVIETKKYNRAESRATALPISL